MNWETIYYKLVDMVWENAEQEGHNPLDAIIETDCVDLAEELADVIAMGYKPEWWNEVQGGLLWT